jgi:hypothetical protein
MSRYVLNESGRLFDMDPPNVKRILEFVSGRWAPVTDSITIGGIVDDGLVLTKAEAEAFIATGERPSRTSYTTGDNKSQD